MHLKYGLACFVILKIWSPKETVRWNPPHLPPAFGQFPKTSPVQCLNRNPESSSNLGRRRVRAAKSTSHAPPVTLGRLQAALEMVVGGPQYRPQNATTLINIVLENPRPYLSLYILTYPQINPNTTPTKPTY